MVSVVETLYVAIAFLILRSVSRSNLSVVLFIRSTRRINCGIVATGLVEFVPAFMFAHRAFAAAEIFARAAALICRFGFRDEAAFDFVPLVFAQRAF